VLRQALEAADRGERMTRARAYLQALDEADRLYQAIGQARDNYRGFLQANFEGRSIFNRNDLRFLSDFDERVLYAKPISAMTRIMARHLKARNGNILAATAGYNAGLGRTRYRSRIYDRYGRIPAIEETVNYVSRILIKHHELLQRL
jgi:soluble lytic murein transglycosylase-like protein